MADLNLIHACVWVWVIFIQKRGTHVKLIITYIFVVWSVSSILAGLLSFMLEEQETFGSVQTTEEEKRKMALDSMNVNLKNQHFCTLFPELVQDYKKVPCWILFCLQ